MQCIILVAGRGVRMGDLTKNCPKPMLPIKNRPKLSYTMENLPSEITEVIFVVGYLGEQIKNYFGNEYAGLKIKYIQQDILNGSAGAVSLAEELIKDRALVLMGDDLYLKSDLEKLLQYPQAILVYQTEEAEKFGLVSMDQGGYLTGVLERPHQQKEGLINTGAYVLSKEYFKVSMVAISETEYGLPQTLASMYSQQKTKIVLAKKWLPIGDAQALELAQKKIREFI